MKAFTSHGASQFPCSLSTCLPFVCSSAQCGHETFQSQFPRPLLEKAQSLLQHSDQGKGKKTGSKSNRFFEYKMCICEFVVLRPTNLLISTFSSFSLLFHQDCIWSWRNRDIDFWDLFHGFLNLQQTDSKKIINYQYYNGY